MRRALYAHVARRGDFVGRDQAAAAVGIARGLAAFHLDKLAQEGLLEVVYRRPPGRAGPGAGRPAKLYRRSRQQVSITLPRRDYEMLSELLARALDQELPSPISARLDHAARWAGTGLAAEARRLSGRRPNRRRLLQAAEETLWEHGFEPHWTDGEIVLRSCPFEAVARAHAGVVCRMNLSLLQAFVGGLNVKGVAAQPLPREDLCCVAIQVGFDAPQQAAP